VETVLLDKVIVAETVQFGDHLDTQLEAVAALELLVEMQYREFDQVTVVREFKVL
jgi:hypothetical protein